MSKIELKMPANAAKASALPRDRRKPPPNEEEQLPIWYRYTAARIEQWLDGEEGDELFIRLPSPTIAAAVVKELEEDLLAKDLHGSSEDAVVRVVIVR